MFFVCAAFVVVFVVVVMLVKFEHAVFEILAGVKNFETDVGGFAIFLISLMIFLLLLMLLLILVANCWLLLLLFLR